METSPAQRKVTDAEASVLIVEDDRPLARLLESFLRSQSYEVRICHTATEAGAHSRDRAPNVILLDLALPPENDVQAGLKLLGHFLRKAPHAKVIIITGEGTIDTAMTCICRGAEDYLVKPINLATLSVIIDRALKRQRLELRMEELQNQRVRNARLGELIGASFLMQRIFAKIRQAAQRDDNVLLLGESGTGKGVVAETLHALSRRRNKPFVKVNCTALYEGLLESELFGHEKGAFTGAVRKKVGKFEYATGGTLFLDEIGEIPGWIQAKLLHAVEDKEIQRIGGNHPVHVDTRIIAATNTNIQEQVRDKRFRLDLYYRLNTSEILLPPLRKREGDVQLLAEHFLRAHESIAHRGLSLSAVEKLMQYDWPGNVRELRSVIARAVARPAEGGWIEPHHLEIDAEEEESTHPTPPRSLQEKLEQYERIVILGALSRNQGNVSRAARELRLTRSGLHKKILRLGICKDEFLH